MPSARTVRARRPGRRSPPRARRARCPSPRRRGRRWSTQRASVGVSGSTTNPSAIIPSTPPRAASASSCHSARFRGWSYTARQPACVTEKGTSSSSTSRQVCSEACARSRTTPSSRKRRTERAAARRVSPCSGVSMPPANSFGWFQVRLAERTPRSHQSSNARGIALERLDALHREHEPQPRIVEVGAGADRADALARSRRGARRNSAS